VVALTDQNCRGGSRPITASSAAKRTRTFLSLWSFELMSIDSDVDIEISPA